MFQFPRFPPGHRPGARYDHGRVAPFGDLRITDCQRLPGAFRRVAASFIGLVRPGIHPVPSSGSSPHTRHEGGPGVVFFVVRAVTPVVTTHPAPPGWGSRHSVRQGATTSPMPTCGAAGIRTPDLRRARAALSRLSYGPVVVARARYHPVGWARLDSNQGPRPYQGRALTS